MNVGIIVACVFTFPIFFENVKVYIHSATTSIRTLLVSSSGKKNDQWTSDLPKDSFLQTHESTQISIVDVDQHVEFHDFTRPRQWAGVTN